MFKSGNQREKQRNIQSSLLQNKEKSQIVKADNLVKTDFTSILKRGLF